MTIQEAEVIGNLKPVTQNYIHNYAGSIGCTVGQLARQIVEAVQPNVNMSSISDFQLCIRELENL
jgi:hypothetical protein